MSELTQNINVRTTHQMKKKVMDESHKRGMNMSEYILFSLEDYWNIILQEKSHTSNDQEILRLTTLLLETQSELNSATTQLSQLSIGVGTIKHKSVWQEANETAEKLTQERIDQEKAIAVQEFIEQNLSKLLTTEEEKLQWYANRLRLYETEILKKVFGVARKNPKVKDLPDVVQILANQYYQQFLTQPRHV